MKKSTWTWLGVAIAVAAALIALSLLAARQPNTLGDDSLPAKNTPKTDDEQPKDTACPAIAAAGRYVDYSEKIVTEKCSGYGQTILFFHAPWCIECRGFDQAINAGEVPAGVQILKVDYDASQDLRKKYDVTIQSTFVSIDQSGNAIRKWTGYGKDKSVDAIIENTQ